jgi:hypothetical protein
MLDYTRGAIKKPFAEELSGTSLMTVDITIDTSDLDRVIAQFGGDILRPPMTKSLALFQAEMATYPPQPSGSTYRRGIDPRSEKLGQKWTYEIRGSGNSIEGILGNNVSYGPYVQDAERQARHMTHWQTDEQVADENERQVIGFFDEYLQDLADG